MTQMCRVGQSYVSVNHTRNPSSNEQTWSKMHAYARVGRVQARFTSRRNDPKGVDAEVSI